MIDGPTLPWLGKNKACIEGTSWAMQHPMLSDAWDALVRERNWDWLLWVACKLPIDNFKEIKDACRRNSKINTIYIDVLLHDMPQDRAVELMLKLNPWRKRNVGRPRNKN